MGTLFLVLLSIYIGIALYEFYMSFLMGEDVRASLIDSFSWPLRIYDGIRQIFGRNVIDKEGP